MHITNSKDMQNLILTPIAVEELVNLIASEVESRINRTEKSEPLQDRLSLHDAEKITGLSLSMLYKLTMDRAIPFEKYGRKLIFSRKDLDQWMNNRTVRKLPTSEIAENHLSIVANKKRAV